jgi:hypothetical protein
MNRIPLSVGHGMKSTDVTRREFDFEELLEWVSHPAVDDKDGEWFMRGGDATVRSNDSLKTAELLILDGDKTLDLETGEVTSGAPDPGMVHEALVALNITHILYTTHSNDPDGVTDKPGWRYRVLIPAKMRRDELDDCVDYAFELLHAKKVPLEPVNENTVWGQLWYTPRIREQGAPFWSTSFVGEPFDVRAALVAGDDRRRAQRTMDEWRPTKPASVREGNTIEEFNRACGIDSVRHYLEGAGYKFAYKRGETYRYIRPNSETGTAGVVVFKGKYGDWCTYSHHGSADPLSGKVCDPFALMATFKFGGNTKAAALSLREKQPDPPKPKLEAEIEIDPLTVDETPEPPAPPQKPEHKPRVRLVRADELTRVKVPWLVNKLIPANSFAILYGKPGTYKSFIALYLSAHIATGGTVFSGRVATKGDVVYIAAEGRGGLHQRWAALRDHYDFPSDTPLYFVEAALDLRESDQDYIELVDAIKSRSANPRMIVVDTLARTFGGGDENDASEMSRFINTQGALQQEFGCAVLAVHHSGKDEARGMRGSSALLGAADVVMFLSRDVETNGGTVLVQKMKDGEDGVVEKFAVMPWTDPNDPETTSLVVEAVDPQSIDVTPAGEKESEGLEVLRKEIKRSGTVVSDPVLASWDVRSIPLSDWKDAYITWCAINGISPDTAKRYFRDLKKSLWEKKKVSIVNKTVWINGASDD